MSPTKTWKLVQYCWPKDSREREREIARERDKDVSHFLNRCAFRLSAGFTLRLICHLNSTACMCVCISLLAAGCFNRMNKLALLNMVLHIRDSVRGLMKKLLSLKLPLD